MHSIWETRLMLPLYDLAIWHPFNLLILRTIYHLEYHLRFVWFSYKMNYCNPTVHYFPDNIDSHPRPPSKIPPMTVVYPCSHEDKIFVNVFLSSVCQVNLGMFKYQIWFDWLLLIMEWRNTFFAYWGNEWSKTRGEIPRKNFRISYFTLSKQDTR